MRKRERENPCGVCGHYHKYEEGEVCGICGHRVPVTSDKSSPQFSPFSSEILPGFLYLGSYDNASRCEFVKAQGISCILNTVPSCQNLYKNSFTYHCLPDDKSLPFDDAIQILEQCEKDKARVLVHCMSGKNRSPAIVIAYLMKTRKWRLPLSYQWVKERRPFVELTSAVYESLQEYEQKIFQSVDSSSPALPVYQYPGASGFSFGLPKNTHMTPSPAGVASIFSLPLGVASSPFTFGGGQTSTTVTQTPFSANPANPSNGFNE